MQIYDNCRVYLNSLLTAIKMPEEMIRCILSEYEAHPDILEEPLPETGASLIDLLPGTDVLTRHLAAAARNRLDGCWTRFPEDVYLATMGVFTRFVNEYHRSYGYYGFDRGFWTTRQVSARLFRLGELEYELFDEEGIKRIGVHIPSNVHLEGSLLNRSVEMSRSFLHEYFPEWASYDYFCESWLLSGTLKDLLPPGSRILKFQEAFDLQDQEAETKDYLEWVFHIAGGQMNSVDLQDLKEDTSLQKRLKAYMLSGGSFHNGEGYLVRSFPE